MEPKYRFRLFILTALVLAGCGTLLTRLYEFQIDRRAQFVANIPTTHTVTIREPAVRGPITDRNGTVLADNRRSYEIIFNLEDIYRGYQLLNIDSSETDPNPNTEEKEELKKEEEIARIIREHVIPRLESFGLSGERYTKNIKPHYLTHGGLVPYVYRQDLSPEEFAQVAVRCSEIPGVEVRVMPRRFYQYGTLAGHLLGYVKQWAKGDELPKEYRNLKNIHFQGDEYGIMGVEKTANEYLKGEGGKRILVRNERRKVVATDDYQPARQGAEVQLTIDVRIQFLVENILRRIGRGAAVVMNPNTGEVLAMASVPNFDPNEFVPSITIERKNFYDNNKANPYINRAISAYLPGSTFKLPTAIAGIIGNSINYHHNCIGYTSFGPTGKLKIGCWKKGGHGSLGMSDAVKRSCNPYFMTLAGDLKSKVMVDTFELLGFGRKSGILLPTEYEGLVPGSSAWRRKNAGASMTLANLALFSIGQGESLATPLQICSTTATIANGGRYYQPRIIRKVIQKNPGERELILKEDEPILKADLSQHGVSEYQLETIRKGMWKAVNEPGGTAGSVAMKNISIAAKTGTAQVRANDPKNTHNAWTTSFAPYENPRYAICVMVRNGQSGGKVAGVLTHLIYRGLFGLEAGFNQQVRKMGVYEGNFEGYPSIDLPEGDLLALAIGNDGETGNEIDPTLINSGEPIKVRPNTIPLPNVAPVPDEDSDE